MSSNYGELVEKRRPAVEVIEEVESQVVDSSLPRVGQLRRDRVAIILGDCLYGEAPASASLSEPVTLMTDSGSPIIDSRPQVISEKVTSSRRREADRLQAEKTTLLFNEIEEFRRPKEAGVKTGLELVVNALLRNYKSAEGHNLFEEILTEDMLREAKESQPLQLPDPALSDRWKMAFVSINNPQQALETESLDTELIREFSNDSSNFYYRKVKGDNGRIATSGTILFSSKKAA